MSKFKLLKKEEYFGIKNEQGKIVIPFTHSTKIDAIGEFRFWEEVNNQRSQNRKFLDHTLSIEEINQICEELLQQEPELFI